MASDRILTPEQVEAFARGSRFPGVLPLRLAVCASHEALRAERDEARAQIAELEAEVERLKAKRDKARGAYGQGRTKEELTDIIRVLRGRIAELEAERDLLVAIAEAAQEWKDAEDAVRGITISTLEIQTARAARARLRSLLEQKP